MSGVIDTLQTLAADLSNRANPVLLGVKAADFIRNHLVKDSFDPLSPATSAYRGNGKPLQDTGNLRDSICAEKVNGTTVSVGTTRIDAPLHNNGGTITAKKNWLFIPAAGTKTLQRRYGTKPGNVLSGLRADGLPPFRIGRTVCYRTKTGQNKVVYYLKKTVVIPKREFFYLTDSEMSAILNAAVPAV